MVRPIPSELAEAIARVRERKLTYLSARCLEDLADGVAEAERDRRPGLVIEAGTALGGSAIVMALAKAPERRMRVYDAFGMIPPPSDRDGEDVHRRYATIESGRARGIGGETYYGYRANLLEEVTRAFESFGVPVDEANVELIKGYFEQTLHVAEPVAFAHLDGDWYASTMTCLRRIEPHLVPGARVVVDDYDKWSGCRRAVDDYFKGRRGYTVERRARLHIVKEPEPEPRRRWWWPARRVGA